MGTNCCLEISCSTLLANTSGRPAPLECSFAGPVLQSPRIGFYQTQCDAQICPIWRRILGLCPQRLCYTFWRLDVPHHSNRKSKLATYRRTLKPLHMRSLRSMSGLPRICRQDAAVAGPGTTCGVISRFCEERCQTRNLTGKASPINMMPYKGRYYPEVDAP